jgi:hypothetical protein
VAGRGHRRACRRVLGVAALPSAAADPAPATEPPAEATTQLSTPPVIEAPPHPGDDPTLVSRAKPTIQHGAAPIIVSSWGTEGSAENTGVPMPTPEDTSQAPDNPAFVSKPAPDGYRYAGTWIRLAALIIDGLVQLAVGFALGMGMGIGLSLAIAYPSVNLDMGGWLVRRSGVCRHERGAASPSEDLARI